jgi:hypothetical protein
MIQILSLLIILFSCSRAPTRSFTPNEFMFKKNEGIKNQAICVIGDAGHGTVSQKEIGDELVNEKCEHVYYVGDIIYQRGLKNENDPQFMTHFFNPYKKLIDAPFFKGFHIILGNHDYKGDKEVFKKLAKSHAFILENDLFYGEQYDDLCFFIFDTTPFAWNLHNHEQVNQPLWFQEQKKNLKNQCKGAIAFTHHPYISSGFHGDSYGNLKKFHEDNIIGTFDILFSGHDHHLSDEGAYQETKLFISGAGDENRGYRRNPYQKGFIGSERGFIKFKIVQDQVELKFVLIDDNGKKSYTPPQLIKLKGLR